MQERFGPDGMHLEAMRVTTCSVIFGTGEIRARSLMGPNRGISYPSRPAAERVIATRRRVLDRERASRRGERGPIKGFNVFQAMKAALSIEGPV